MRHVGPVVMALLLALGVTGCGGPAGGGPVASFPPPACEVVPYPCTWSEVDQAVVKRGDALGEIGLRLLLGGGSPDDVVRLLENAPSVAEVLRFDHRVRFRLTGGRPMWIAPPGELDHHRPDAAAGGREIAAEASEEPVPARSLRHHLLRLSNRLGPRPLLAASIAPPGQSGVQVPRVTGDPGSGKKARVLAPFEWEFPEYGNNFSRRVRLIRDYREKAGGTVELYADLREFEENPDDPGSSYRTAGGETLLRGEVDVDDFLGWDAYHLVIVATHGTRDPCPWALKKDLPDRKAFEHYAEYMEAVTAALQCPSVWAGLAFREDYASYPGVEPVAFTVRRDSPNEDLTPAEAAECVQLLEAGEDLPHTFGGAPCLRIGAADKTIVSLTFEFFQWAYPKGLSDAVVFVASCRSGLNRYLLDQLTGARAGGSNRAVAAFGFEEPVNYADAFAVVDSMITYVDQGYHSRELLRRLQAMPRVTSLVGRALAPDDLLPPRPSAIVGEEQAATHARDVALLVDPASGEELQDGATVLVRGVPGDGKPDSLRLRARIIGVASDDPIEDVRLFVSPKDGAGGPAYRPERRVEEGVFEFEGDLQLGRDHREGEIVDLEIRAQLPKGGESRWVYRDIRLASFSWTLSVSGGPAAGAYLGPMATASLDSAGRVIGISLYSGPDVRPDVTVQITPPAQAGYEPGASASRGSFEVLVNRGDPHRVELDLRRWNAQRVGLLSAPRPEPGYPPPPTIQIESVDDGVVVGTAEGVFWQVVPQHDLGVRGTMRVEFRARACRSDEPQFARCAMVLPSR